MHRYRPGQIAKHHQTVYKVAELSVDLTSVPEYMFKLRQNKANQLYYEVNFQVELSATSSLEYAVSIDGARYGSVTARYT
jgi:hypothetical protein